MFSKRTILFLLFYFFSFSVYSQYQDLHFKHLTTDEGLSQSNVTCILQDSKGFMWFGTFNGLNRYDGYGFDVFYYNPGNPRSLSHNYISALCEDADGYLWVGTSDGLNRFDRKIDSFTAFKHQKSMSNSLSDNQVETIFQDSRGKLWIGTRNGGLELFDPESESFIHYTHGANSTKSLSSNFVRFLFEDSDGNLWIAHDNGAIDIFDKNRTQIEPLLVNGEKLSDFRITAIVESGNKNIWIATQGEGLYRLTSAPDRPFQIEQFSIDSPHKTRLSSNTILCLSVTRDNKIWIGTEDRGINILDTQTNTIQYVRTDPYIQSSLNHNSVWSIYEDRAGSIWVGTYAHGVNLLSPRKSAFKHYKHHPGKDDCLSHNMVNSILEDRQNRIWIATDGGGLNLFNRDNGRFLHYNSENSSLKTDVIVSVYEDSRERLWLGTWTDGLYQFNRKTKTFTHYTQQDYGLGSNSVVNIGEDRTGGLWLCTFWGGLTYFNSDDGTVVVYTKENSGLSDNDVRCLLRDVDGNLWIGTDIGLDFFNPRTKRFINYRHNEKDSTSLSKGFVHTVIQTRDSTIWIGTTGGLNKFDRASCQFCHYNTADGLPDAEIKCIVEGQNGTLWLSTNKGIAHFDTESETFKNYDVTDGLQGNDFNARSGIKTEQGEIIFGGNNGFTIFHPDDIMDNAEIPPVVITDFKIFNKTVPIGVENSPLQKHISETKDLVLSHRESMFSFEFAALSYISPEKNQYAYMMEGFETDWNYVNSRHSATYTNLDPGEYVFRVKASNSDGIWNEEGVSVNISITPPFWKTWWAYLIEILVGLALIYLVLSYFISRQRLKNELAREEQELEKMYEQDQMKTRFFTNIAHEFHSPLTLILSPLEKLISSAKTDEKTRASLSLVQGNARRLQRMLGQLKDIQKIETDDLQLSLVRGNIVRFVERIVSSFRDHAKERHVEYKFNAEKDSAVVWYDQDKLDKIVYNLLSNAFKFTPDGGRITVTVSVFSPPSTRNGKTKRMAKEYAEITVQDSGIGIPKEKIDHIFERYYHIEDYKGRHYEGTGIGLAFVYELINLYGGEINVSSKEGEGATFSVRIPIDEQYLEENQLVGEFNILPANNLSDSDRPSTDTDDLADSEIALSKIPVKDIPIILVVEDDKCIRDYIKTSLESRYRVFTAKNGRAGFKKAKSIIPNLIISDVKMPEIGGIELCKMLKEEEKTSHIPVILLTAFSASEAKIKGLSGGADAYLTKPFSLDVLEAHISNLLESRKKLRLKFSRKVHLEPAKIDIEDGDQKFLQHVMETVETHMSDSQFNAEMLSKKVGMSRMQLYRKLRELTNQTVHEFIRSIRLKRAVQLLEQKRMTITEVAYEVGFNDLTYFARCFRKMYQKSPSEYISR